MASSDSSELSASDALKGHKRKFATKTRTGCLTCRKRRIKCDEKKPNCMRCMTGGWDCDGYPATKPSRPARISSSNRRLLPLVSSKVNSQTIHLIETHQIGAKFENGEEFRYFRHFTETAAWYLGGSYDPELWNRIVLQASENEAAIRHAVIAIGALDLMHPRFEGTGGQAVTEYVTDSTRARHLFALRHYSLAIKEMQRTIALQTQDLRIVLSSSLLFICFEAYHGNYQSASRQIHLALKMLEEANKNSPVDPRDTEDEPLIRMFDRLDVQSMTHSDPYTVQDHMRLKDTDAQRLTEMPLEFVDLEQARIYFHIVVRRITHFATMARKMSNGICASLMDHEFAISCQTLPELRVQNDTYLQELRRWSAAFSPVLESSQKSEVPMHIQLSGVLHSTVIVIGMHMESTNNGSDESWYDERLHDFKKVLELCSNSLMNDTPGVHGAPSNFKFNVATIFPLDFVAKKCRDPSIRRQAIHLLAFRPRREGLWDSLVSANVCSWAMRLEEKGIVNGIVPEEWRLRNVGMRVDVEGQKVHAWADQYEIGSVPKHLVRRTTVIAW